MKGMRKIARFVKKYLHWVEDFVPGRNITVDWGAFGRDLRHCPRVAFEELGIGSLPPFAVCSTFP